jgi:hypothetical protein
MDMYYFIKQADDLLQLFERKNRSRSIDCIRYVIEDLKELEKGSG